MKHTCRQGCGNESENVIARSETPSPVIARDKVPKQSHDRLGAGSAISKNKIATPSARNDRIDAFSGESYSRKLFTVHCSLFTNKTGFTLIETIMVMVIIAILAVAIVVRNPFDAIKLRSAARKVAGDIRYVQKLAISNQTRCGIVFNGATSYTVFELGNTSDPAPSPGDPCSTVPDGADADTTDDFIVAFNDTRCSQYNGVTISLITLYFNSLGTPVDSGGMPIGTDQSVTVTYNGTQQITITAGTGRVSIP